MAFAKLTPSQAATLRNARAAGNDADRKKIKKDLFTAVKARYSIPTTQKLVVEDEGQKDHFLVVRDKRTRRPLLIDDHGKFIGVAAPDAAGAKPTDKTLWIAIDRDAILDALNSADADDDATPTTLPDDASVFNMGGIQFAVTKEGQVFARS